MNQMRQPIIKRPASAMVRFPGQSIGEDALLPVLPKFGSGMQGGPTPVFNPHAPMKNYNTDLDNLYPDGEKQAMKKALQAQLGPDLHRRPMLQKELEALNAIHAVNPNYQPPPVGAGRAGTTYQAVSIPVITAGAPTGAAPLPMTVEEVEAYTRRARKAAKHPKLVRAEVCLNCEFFYAYTRGTDTQRLTLCKWDSTSPWDKTFTCGTSKCKDYLEIGSEPPKAAEPPAEKKKRRRRSRAEVEASKAQESNACAFPVTVAEAPLAQAENKVASVADPNVTPAPEEPLAQADTRPSFIANVELNP